MAADEYDAYQEEVERRRLKAERRRRRAVAKSGRSVRLLQQIIQERSQGLRPPKGPKRRRRKRR